MSNTATGTVRCGKCRTPVTVWSLSQSFVFWFFGGGVVMFVGALTLFIGVGFVILPIGALMTFGAPALMFATRGMRRCTSCKASWTPRKDAKKAV